LKGHEQRIECHREALAAKNEPFTLVSDQPEGSSAFGVEKGGYRIDCMGINISSLLEKHQPIDAIKVDCEGGEVHLLEMSNTEICSIPFWMVETHTKELYHSIIKKFSENGFANTYDIELNSDVNLLHFKRLT
ncbi:MAG TPA: FkbM family methyltransferase, partial [Parachlamydiaceae bacterium]|nr:FkbM family methyltransferase [Parachlamydiaceae bacterium]